MRMRDREPPECSCISSITPRRRPTSHIRQKPAPDRKVHICGFIKALGDSRLRPTLQGQRFDTLSELEETLKRIEALQRDESRDPQQKRSPIQNLQFDRFKPQQRRAAGCAFLADGGEVDSSPGRHANFKDGCEPSSENQVEAEAEARVEVAEA